MNSLSSSATPELRVVSTALARAGAMSQRPFGSELQIPDVTRDASDRAFVQRGMEAFARYSSSHVDQSPTPWEWGSAPSVEEQREREQRTIAVSTTELVVTTDGAGGAVAFGGPRTLDTHAGVPWSAPGQPTDASLEKMGEASSISIVRTLARVADPVLQMADALRAIRLNQIRVGDGLTLKLDGRTGRHARCFAVLTQRF
jgi:hypothetical protein